MDNRVLCIGSLGVAISLCAVGWVWAKQQSEQKRAQWQWLSVLLATDARQEQGAGWREGALKEDPASDSDVDVEIPDHYKDPISLSVIVDPVVLCGTGQVYCYHTVREWFKTGNRICPRSNIEVLDVQLTRLPWLKQEIREWCAQHNVKLPEDESLAETEKLKAVNPNLPSWIADIRGDSGAKRIKATTEVFELLRQWEANSYDFVWQQQNKPLLLARAAVMDDMVWLLRYGDAYLQGIAASTLSFCSTPDEVQWLAPTAAIPAVALCLSANHYTAQAATRLLYNIARAGNTARRAIFMAGGAQSLLRIISTSRQKFGYSRDRAAATLAILAKDPDAKAHLAPIALEPLKAMLQSDATSDRYEKRDVATALLALSYTQEELGPEVTIDRLFQYFWCSRAWLLGQVDEPDAGYTQDELMQRTNLDFWRANMPAVMDQLLARDIVLQEAGDAVEGGVVVGEVAAGALPGLAGERERQDGVQGPQDAQ